MGAKNKHRQKIDTLQTVVSSLQLKIATLEGQLMATLERLKQVENQQETSEL
ncbi:hypothetical protein [Leptolyngbya sp. FACHB-261]|uniref:hypothetical protein n=1 Tax=Leptolyngbya sp. FACHB-261 TaxID=2692806 RepID=UPI0016827623|nr:hypothetical protein [Leptolyngbya sp. FACHB-261]MBD2102005.1 hypothetical protein [Leptolyngbya sp. FACHB-261]